MTTKTTLLIYLITCAIIDIVIPIPIVALIMIHVVFHKPKWFKELVGEIYNG